MATIVSIIAGLVGLGKFYDCSYAYSETLNICRPEFSHIVYGHKIWAKGDKEAEEIVTRFGFRLEGVTNFPPDEYRPSVLALQPGGLNRHDVIHAVCFLSFLAHKAGITNAAKNCGDQSALHEIIHFRAFGKEVNLQITKQNIAKGIDFLEKNVPGMPPKYIKLIPYIGGNSDRSSNDLNDPFVVSDWLK